MTKISKSTAQVGTEVLIIKFGHNSCTTPAVISAMDKNFFYVIPILNIGRIDVEELKFGKETMFNFASFDSLELNPEEYVIKQEIEKIKMDIENLLEEANLEQLKKILKMLEKR